MPEIVVKKILITQPRPESDKSPYFDLARRHNVEMAFLPFIRLEGIASKDFRRQKWKSAIIRQWYLRAGMPSITFSARRKR